MALTKVSTDIFQQLFHFISFLLGKRLYPIHRFSATSVLVKELRSSGGGAVASIVGAKGFATLLSGIRQTFLLIWSVFVRCL